MFLYLAAAILLMILSALTLTASLFSTRHRRLALEHRLDLVSKLKRRAGADIEQSRWPATILRLDLSLRQIFAFHVPYRWGMTSGIGVLLPLGLVASAALWAILTFGFGLGPVVVLPLTLAAFIAAPRFRLRREQKRAEKRFMTLFPDTVDMMVRMLRAGLPITSAIRTVGNEAPPPVDALFTGLADQIAIGINFDEALALAGDRIGGADFRFFAAAVTLQRSTGGNLASTLDMLAEIVRRRRAARMKAQAATAEVRLSAYVLGAMPFVVTGLLLVLNPHYLAPLIADPRGKIMIGVAIGLLLLAFLSMRQLMRSIETV
jgi:tight adherence protein B